MMFIDSLFSCCDGFSGFRIEIPGIHVQDQNIAMICSDNNEINETMLQIIQSLLKNPNVNISHIYNSVFPKVESQGEMKEELHESQGRLPGPSRSDSSLDSQGGRLEHVSSGQRQLKGAIRLGSTRIRWFS
jgi:hypothetical protein